MILVIGTENCNSCTQTKKTLDEKGIEYDYKLTEELDPFEWKNIRKEAIKAGQMTMPILLQDNQVIKLENLLNEVK